METRVYDVAAGHIRRLASQAAKDFDVLQCTQAVESIVSSLKSEGFSGTIIETQATFPNGQKSITGLWCNVYGGVISKNGFHTGVLVDGKVFDNIHKNGIDLVDWLKDFGSIFGTTLKPTFKTF